jgi:hypothetical protein
MGRHGRTQLIFRQLSEGASSWSSRLAASLLLLTAQGCVGDIGDGEQTRAVVEPICNGQVSPGKSPIRRLTRYEYNNTVRDLLGVVGEPANELPAEEEALGFANNASALNVSPLLAEKYMTLAESVSQLANSDPEALTGCSITTTPDEQSACIRTFIETFGKKAFRRPLTAQEISSFEQVYGAAAEVYFDAEDLEETAFREGVGMVLEAFLQSPEFLYRVELGEGVTPFATAEGVEVVPLNSWEMASRLSFFLWGSMPDDELFSLAEADSLTTKEQVASQARRMLADPRARDAVATFHQQWLDYDRVNNVTKDPELFPEWSPAIGALMREEMMTFVDHVVFDGPGDFGTLLTANYTFANSELAGLYGVTSSGDGFERIDFGAEQHSGLLSMGAILAYNAHTNQTSPIHRGKLVREAFLCDTLAPPPPDLVFEVPEPSPDATTRERFAEHSSNPACSACHRLMDPLGFGFENFDSLGRYRTSESNGLPIDASGAIVDSDIDGTFIGLRELSERLATSDEVKACYATMWFRFAYGRGETAEDVCSLSNVESSFRSSGGNVRELLVALTQSDAFLYRLASSEAQ